MNDDNEERSALVWRSALEDPLKEPEALEAAVREFFGPKGAPGIEARRKRLMAKAIQAFVKAIP